MYEAKTGDHDLLIQYRKEYHMNGIIKFLY